MSEPPKACLWVQHLLGTGHTVRAAALARALSGAGFDTTLILGATPPATLDLSGIKTLALPPVLTTDKSFKQLAGPDGPYEKLAPARRAAVLRAVENADVFIIESYPFGRKPFAVELDEPIAAVRAGGGVVVASVRDILVRKNEARRARMAAAARAKVDHIIVHGDAAVTGPQDTFHMGAEALPPLHYTGYIHTAPAQSTPPPQNGAIIVTAGGSGVGEAVFEAAVGAAALWPDSPPWHLLVASPLAHRIKDWQSRAPKTVTIEPNRPDFQTVLAGAALSVSQAGYNTVLDALSAGPPMVLIPFADGEETEQTDRARIFSQHSGIIMLATSDLSPASLARACQGALAGPRPTLTLRLDGAARAAERIKALVTP